MVHSKFSNSRISCKGSGNFFLERNYSVKLLTSKSLCLQDFLVIEKILANFKNPYVSKMTFSVQSLPRIEPTIAVNVVAKLRDVLLRRESIGTFVPLLTRSQESFSTCSQQVTDVTVLGQTCLTFSSISVDPGGEDRGSSSFTSAPRAAYSWPCWGRGGETTNPIICLK